MWFDAGLHAGMVIDSQINCRRKVYELAVEISIWKEISGDPAD